MNPLRIPRALFGAIISLALAGPALAQEEEGPAIPEELHVFDFLLGDARTTVEFFNLEGEVRDVREFAASTEPIVQGLVYRGRSGPAEGPLNFGETWYFYDELNEEYTITSVDAQGNFDVFTGVILDDRMVFTNRPKTWRNGREIQWRRTYYNIEDDRHEVIMEYTYDRGYSWIRANHWVVTKAED